MSLMNTVVYQKELMQIGNIETCDVNATSFMTPSGGGYCQVNEVQIIRHLYRKENKVIKMMQTW